MTARFDTRLKNFISFTQHNVLLILKSYVIPMQSIGLRSPHPPHVFWLGKGKFNSGKKPKTDFRLSREFLQTHFIHQKSTESL